MKNKLPLLAVLFGLLISGCTKPTVSSNSVLPASSTEASETSKENPSSNKVEQSSNKEDRKDDSDKVHVSYNSDIEDPSSVVASSNSQKPSSEHNSSSQKPSATSEEAKEYTFNLTADKIWPNLGDIGTTGYANYNGDHTVSINGTNHNVFTSSSARNTQLGNLSIQMKKFKDNVGGYLTISNINVTKVRISYIDTGVASVNDFAINFVSAATGTVINSEDTGTVQYSNVTYKKNVVEYTMSGTGDLTITNGYTGGAVYICELLITGISGGNTPTPSSSYNSSSSSSCSSFSQSSQGGSSYTTSITPDSNWPVDFSTYGATFRNTLATLINQKGSKKTSYDSMLSVGEAASKTSGSYFVPFYHTAAQATTVGSCNREHTWPNSRGGGKDNGGAIVEQDPFMIRPTLTKENNSRSNFFYGLGGKSELEWDPASCESGFYEARGEAARVILYAATRYYSLGLSLSNNPDDATSKKTMGTLKYLIQWNNQYAPTTVEKQINDYLSSQGYGRNPFVDHPEYANFIWTENGLRTSGSDLPSVSQTSQIQTSVTPVTYEYSLVDALNDIDGADLIIGSSDTLGGQIYCMTTEHKSSTTSGDLPWYIIGSIADQNNDSSKININEPTFFHFEQQGNGEYTIYNQSTNTYLFSYQETKTTSNGTTTHYSIGLYTNISSCPGEIKSNNWSITTSGTGFEIKSSTTNVYIEYYIGKGGASFQGYTSAGKSPIFLYK